MELKNTLKVIGISLFGVLGVGMSCYSHSVGMTLLSPSYEKVSAYYVESYSDSVTFSADELNNCNYSYLSQKYLVDEPVLLGSYIIYWGDRYVYIETTQYQIQWYNEENEVYTQFVISGENTGYWLNDGALGDFDENLTIYSSWFVNNMSKQTTLTASQLNNNTYDYLANQLHELTSDTQLQNSYIIYNNIVYTFNEFSSTDYLKYTSNNQSIDFNLNGLEYSGYYWSLNEDLDNQFTNSITIYSTYIADNLYAPNQPSTLLQAIVSLLTGGIVGLSGGIGSGVSTLISQIFIVDNALSVFGGILVVFAGISLAIGLSRWIMQFLTSLGAKK